MTTHQSFPPHRTSASEQLTRLQTQTWLATYLQNASSAALLQPDALLTASGPVSAQGASSVTMHNLRRLLAGLNGKYDVRESGPLSGESERDFKGAVVNTEEIYGWQDKSEFDREQSVEIGGIDERDPSGGVAAKGGAVQKVVQANEGVDKLARKKAKKERKMEARKAQKASKEDD